jgi:XTP/dITP diphosphohydrolase
MQILVATGNPHKREEIASAFADHADAVDWLDFAAIAEQHPGGVPEPVEDQPTFEGNARLKARYYAQQTGLNCVADDSGIEVDALDGRPGVISARYSGVTGPRSEVDPANNAKLLDELRGVPTESRTARFVCAMCLHLPDKRADGGARILNVRGTVDGRILRPEEADDPATPEAGRGTNGFGYDPLFVLPDGHAFAGKTTAQLTPAQKNRISHRGRAARLLLQAMRDAQLIPR